VEEEVTDDREMERQRRRGDDNAEDKKQARVVILEEEEGAEGQGIGEGETQRKKLFMKSATGTQEGFRFEEESSTQYASSSGVFGSRMSVEDNLDESLEYFPEIYVTDVAEDCPRKEMAGSPEEMCFKRQMAHLMRENDMKFQDEDDNEDWETTTLGPSPPQSRQRGKEKERTYKQRGERESGRSGQCGHTTISVGSDQNDDFVRILRLSHKVACYQTPDEVMSNLRLYDSDQESPPLSPTLRYRSRSENDLLWKSLRQYARCHLALLEEIWDITAQDDAIAPAPIYLKSSNMCTHSILVVIQKV